VFVNLVVIANARGAGDGVWAMCGWLKNNLLISGNGKWELGGNQKVKKGKNYNVNRSIPLVFVW